MAASLTASEQMAKAIGDLHAAGRLGEPGDIAALAALLPVRRRDLDHRAGDRVDGGRSRLRTKG